MQAYGLVVVELDGTKLTELASELTDRGYSVASASVSASDEPAAPAAPAGAEAAEADAPSDGTEPAAVEASAGEGPDNSKPFKCPACGQTFDVEVTCDNQHDATQTLPTEDVLAGATADQAAAPAAEPVPADPGTETPAADPPAGQGDESPATTPSPATPPDEPQWPTS